MHLLVLFSLFSGVFSQLLVNLNTLHGDGEHQSLSGTAPYAIFVSAYSDSTAALQKIFVVTANGVQTPLDTLKNNRNSGEITPFVVNDTAYVTTTLTTGDMKRLHGVMFISSTTQANNKNFRVFDVSMTRSLPSQTQGDYTFLFLNTHMGTNPYQSSIISQWSQNKNTAAYMYQGVPSDVAEGNNYQIFSNPVQSSYGYSQFFSTVEKFSLTLSAFYVKTSNGAPGFRFEPGYYSIDGTTTSQYSTTGFYMKAIGQNDKLVKVNTKRDTNYFGTTGVNTLGGLPTGKKVTVGVYDGSSEWEDSSVANPFFSPWSIPFIGQNIQISSTGGADGQYFVQYFILQGTVKTGSTVHVETTTKSSGRVECFISLFTLLIFIGFL